VRIGVCYHVQGHDAEKHAHVPTDASVHLCVGF